jgi:hypothetical protein
MNDIDGGEGNSRGECSLVVLTNEFLNYMAQKPDYSVDLKQAAIDLGVCLSRVALVRLNTSWQLMCPSAGSREVVRACTLTQLHMPVCRWSAQKRTDDI